MGFKKLDLSGDRTRAFVFTERWSLNLFVLDHLAIEARTKDVKSSREVTLENDLELRNACGKKI